MINHPEQRKITTLDVKSYKQGLRANYKSRQLEFAMYRQRNDMESCQEIRDEFIKIQSELLTFCRAEKRSDKYHGERI